MVSRGPKQSYAYQGSLSGVDVKPVSHEMLKQIRVGGGPEKQAALFFAASEDGVFQCRWHRVIPSANPDAHRKSYYTGPVPSPGQVDVERKEEVVFTALLRMTVYLIKACTCPSGTLGVRRGEGILSSRDRRKRCRAPGRRWDNGRPFCSGSKSKSHTSGRRWSCSSKRGMLRNAAKRWLRVLPRSFHLRLLVSSEVHQGPGKRG